MKPLFELMTVPSYENINNKKTFAFDQFTGLQYSFEEPRLFFFFFRSVCVRHWKLGLYFEFVKN
jgi:hypothetical protein